MRLKVGGTVRTAPCHLDTEGDLAVAYATTWHHRIGGLRIPTSALIRRALHLYARRLDTCGIGEFHLAKAASAGSITDPSATQLAELRLYGTAPDEALPPFDDVLHGHGYLARRSASRGALEDRVEATWAALGVA